MNAPTGPADRKIAGHEIAEHDTRTVTSGDVTIFYRRFGDGGRKTPVIILHGQSYFSYDWIGIAKELSADRNVYAMDMRGFGESSWSPSQAYKVQDFAADVLAVADQEGADKFILVGHSMGGRNATYTASAHGDRLEKLVLVDYSPTNHKAGSARIMNISVDMPPSFHDLDDALRYFGMDPATLDADKRKRFDIYLREINGNYTVPRDPYFKEVFRKTRDEGIKPDHGADLWECLARIDCPILVVRGRDSDMFVADFMDKVRDTNPNITLVEVDGGHNIPGDNPQGLLAVMKPFLAG